MNDLSNAAIGFLIGSFLTAVVVGISVEGCTRMRYEHQAVSRGLGTYDDRNEFQWKTTPEAQR